MSDSDLVKTTIVVFASFVVAIFLYSYGYLSGWNEANLKVVADAQACAKANNGNPCDLSISVEHRK